MRILKKLTTNTTQAPRTSRASLVKGRSQANAVAQQALIAHWQSIVKSLDNYLKMMKANYVSYNVYFGMAKHPIFHVGKFHHLTYCGFTGTSLPGP